jgi:O-antigen/teichoic acid export membrane protein
MSLVKRVFSDSIIYGLAGIISSLLSIFLVPLYTRIFVPADYGIIAIITTTLAFLNLFIIFGIDNSVCIWYWEKASLKYRYRIFNTFVGFVGLSGLTAAFLIAILSRLLSQLFFGTSDYTLLFLLLAFNVLFAGFQKVVNIWCRMRQKPVWAMVYSLILLFFNLSFNIVLIVYLRVGVKGVFISQAIASVIGFVMMLVIFKRWFKIRLFDVPLLKEMLRFSLPLVPAALMYWLMSTASSYFIKFYIKDNAEVGLYQVGSSIANIMSLATYAFFQAWGPISLQISTQENAKKIYSIVFELFCVVGFFCAASLLLLSENILIIFTNDKYLPAATVIGLLAINVIISGIPSFLAIANNLAKKNASYAVAVSIGTVTTILLFIFLIPHWGKEGAAVAMIVGNLSLTIYLAFAAQRIYPIPYNFPRIITVVAAEICFFLALRHQVDNIFYQIFVTLLLLAAIGGIYINKYKIKVSSYFVRPKL